jgi:hypothetical protein
VKRVRRETINVRYFQSSIPHRSAYRFGSLEKDALA